jgi:glycosyltransferase involved in cell wall biosynthesis
MTTNVVRVVVDGRSYTDASSFRGIGSYVRPVVEGLAAREDLDIAVLANRRAQLPPGARRIGLVRVAPGRWQNREHDLLLPLDLARAGGDVVLSPALDPPARCARPWVQTVHDALPIEGRGSDRFRKQAERYRRAAALITISRWTADEAVRLMGLDPARLHVIPHGVATHFRPGPRTADRPYLMFVGEYDPRKRHDLAFAAVGALADRGLPHELRVTGRQAPWYAESLAALHAAAPHPDRVRLLGHVDTDELVRLYQGAEALVVTSEAEGFGFPALEAMACGTPVVAFANSATTEIVGEGGVLVDDGDFEALVRALVSIATEPGRRDDLSARALQRATTYSWAASVGAHAELLRSVAD